MGCCCSKRSDESLAVEFHREIFHAMVQSENQPSKTSSSGRAVALKNNIDTIRENNSRAYNSVTSNNYTPTSKDKRKIVVGVYNYSARSAQDVSFIKGDRMEVLMDSETDWWQVQNLRTNEKGYIPSNFVAIEKSIDSEDWFFGKITRKEAERFLMDKENPQGTFLIRNSENNPVNYSLSLKDWDETKGFHSKHYRIKPVNGGFCITPSNPFPNIIDLVNSYSNDAQGLCQVLTHICHRPKPQIWDLSHQLKDNYEIDRNEIKLIKPLGKGNFGEVWYGTWKDNIEVAVKTLRPGTMSVQAFLEEASIMKKFRHKNLVTLFAVCTTEEPILIVQEFLHKGALLDYMRDDKNRSNLTLEYQIDIAAQIASGMSYLESSQLIHRDLAARNILVGKNQVVKICDFGLARTIEDDEYNSSKQGSKFPVKWTAPEAMIYYKFSIKSDVWSYGILLMEIFTYGQVPYPGMSNHEVMEQIQLGYRMPNPKLCPIHEDIYENIILECWNKYPEKRPAFEYLCHYFENFGVSSESAYRDLA